MKFDEAMVSGFMDELSDIQKEAGAWAGLGQGISSAFKSARTGAKQVFGAATGRVGTNQIVPGLERMAPAAAITAGGGLAAYGAGKAAFGD